MMSLATQNAPVSPAVSSAKQRHGISLKAENGKACASNCSGELCGYQCHSRGCASNCTGSFCGKACQGYRCAYGCVGRGCAMAVLERNVATDVRVRTVRPTCTGKGCSEGSQPSSPSALPSACACDCAEQLAVEGVAYVLGPG